MGEAVTTIYHIPVEQGKWAGLGKLESESGRPGEWSPSSHEACTRLWRAQVWVQNLHTPSGC